MTRNQGRQGHLGGIRHITNIEDTWQHSLMSLGVEKHHVQDLAVQDVATAAFPRNAFDLLRFFPCPCMVFFNTRASEIPCDKQRLHQMVSVIVREVTRACCPARSELEELRL